MSPPLVIRITGWRGAQILFLFRITSPRVRSSSKVPDAGPVGSRHPFGSGISALAALSAPLQGGLRFLRPRLPALRPPPLRSGYHRGGERRAYPVVDGEESGSARLESVPRWEFLDVVVLVRRRAIRPTYLLVTACQPFWPFRSHEA